MSRKMFTFVCLLLFLVLQLPAPAAAGRWVDGSASASGGSRNYRLWVPDGYSSSTPTPLVMVLHGCTQNPNDIAAGTRFNTLADEQNFLVVYPDQPSSANSNKCWNWFETTHQARGSGEPAILAAVVNRVRSTYNVDASRIYVTGISAGGAMSVIMGATYPDIFAAVGVVAGLEYKAGTNLTSGLLAMSQGGPNPNTQGQLAYQAMGSFARRMPVIVFHGSSDTTVYPINGNQVLSQWAQTNDYIDDGRDNNSVDDTAERSTNGQVPNGRSFTQSSYNDGAGRLLLEKWIINGMGHAWPGGSSAGTYTDPQGPDATRETWRFFAASTGNTTPTPIPTATATPGGPTATPTPVPTTPPTATPSTSTSTFVSVGTEDGYAAANTPSGTTGSYASGVDVYAGDNADAPFRGVLSFDTSALPDGATIVSAELRLFYTQAPVGNPWAGMGALVGDIRNGCLGTSCALAASDFEATVSLAAAVSFAAPTSSGAGTRLSGTLSSSALGFINTTGKTQFKLRFQQANNANGISDYLLLAGGEYFNSAYRPVLVVQYR